MFELRKKDKAHAAPDHLARQDRDDQTDGEKDSASSHSQAQSGEIAVIGRSIRIDGDVRGEEDLRIEGDIRGTIQLLNHCLTIGPKGRLKADAYAKSVTVDGEVNGDLYASECVNIHSSARVKGNVVALLVNLEEGARFKGSIDMDPERVECALGKERGAQASASNAGRSNGSKQATAAVVNPTRGKPRAVPGIVGRKKSKAATAK
jgi:cytoskeletal protein CcmA (bactofilin family)